MTFPVWQQLSDSVVLHVEGAQAQHPGGVQGEWIRSFFTFHLVHEVRRVKLGALIGFKKNSDESSKQNLRFDPNALIDINGVLKATPPPPHQDFSVIEITGADVENEKGSGPIMA